MPVDVPDEMLNATYSCPDCAREQGDDGLRFGYEFHWTKAARYKNGVRRRAYCKTHEHRRNTEAKVNAPEGSKTRETKRRLDRAYAKRKAEHRKGAAAKYRASHREQMRAWYTAWAEKNRDKRKQSQDAYRERQKIRGVRPVREKRKPLDE